MVKKSNLLQQMVLVNQLGMFFQRGYNFSKACDLTAESNPEYANHLQLFRDQIVAGEYSRVFQTEGFHPAVQPFIDHGNEFGSLDLMLRNCAEYLMTEHILQEANVPKNEKGIIQFYSAVPLLCSNPVFFNRAVERAHSFVELQKDIIAYTIDSLRDGNPLSAAMHPLFDMYSHKEIVTIEFREKDLTLRNSLYIALFASLAKNLTQRYTTESQLATGEPRQRLFF